MTFRASEMRLELIRADMQNAGIRVHLPAQCGTARLSLQLDIGVGDAVWPDPVLNSYPSLLDAHTSQVFAYSRETVVAEKFEALVVLGDRNSRIKDFFDLHMLASTFEFDRRQLTESIRRTFERRGTPIPVRSPIGLTPAYWKNPSRPAQVRAFAQRAGLVTSEHVAADITSVLADFLLPLLDDLRAGITSPGEWAPRGPWA